MNNKIKNLKGESGGVYIADTTVRNGTFDSITALEATVIASLTSSNITGTLTAVPLPAGATLFGEFTAVTLTSGKVVAYNKV